MMNRMTIFAVRRTFLLLLVLCLLPLWCAAEAALFVRVSEPISSFREHTIMISAPEDGIARIQVSAGGEVYRTLRDVQLVSGENLVRWNGTAEYDEPLPKQTYTVSVAFIGVSGREEHCETSVKAGACSPALEFATPSSDRLYLGSGYSWYINLQLTRTGRVILELTPADSPDRILYTIPIYHKKDAGSPTTSGLCRWNWNGTIDGKSIDPGQYNARCYLEGCPDRAFTFTLLAIDSKPEAEPLFLTGPLMPSRSASDEEIWALMTRPAVVPRGKELEKLRIYERRDSKSKVLGSVYCATTSLEVLEMDDRWARVGTWVVGGYYVEGYVQRSQLKVVSAAEDYGILIDKQTQRMYVYSGGRRIGSLRISTGMRKYGVVSETCAGSYLAGTTVGSFKSHGRTYDYAIRVSGPNLIHSIGRRTGNNPWNYEADSSTLGTKASAGCIRMQRFADDDNALTAYWVWSHIGPGTRIIIMDDKETRHAEAAALHLTMNDCEYTGSGTNSWDIAEDGFLSIP